MTRRTCVSVGGFEPDVRHRTIDASIAVALVARGLAVTMLPALAFGAGHPGIERRTIPASRAIFAATRVADAARPSIRALVSAIRGRGAAVYGGGAGRRGTVSRHAHGAATNLARNRCSVAAPPSRS